MTTQNSPNAVSSSEPNGVISRGILNVLLVFLESAITLMLRFDPKLRQLAYPLAESGKVVCIRTYLPHTKIYATFGYRGVLLDDVLPANKEAPDVIINAYSFQIANVLMNHSESTVESLQIRGESQDVADVKAFLVRVGVGGAIQNLINKLRGNPENKPTPEQKAEKLSELRAKINEQNQRIDEQAKDIARLKTQLAESQNKQKATVAGLIVASIIALVAIVSHFFI